MRFPLAVVLACVFISLGAGALMMHLTGRDQFVQTADPDSKPLNLRVSGYRTDDAAKYWDVLGTDGLAAEVRFLEADLLYPFAYGGSLIVALVLLRRGRPANASALAVYAPATAAMAADWCENSIHLSQIARYLAHEPLSDGWILVAATATTLKWVTVIVAFLVVIAAAARVMRESRSAR